MREEKLRWQMAKEIEMHRTIEARRADRERIQQDTQAYLEAGGRITRLPSPPEPRAPGRW